ncbi:DUF2058 domain-containing protein [Aliidiomarina quisquiliarum]|uniref:DUF2058 domain-containing protein n=1 Tax=Aliidiomarina quisquiliarum TaxID=2938947 RepID=UPI00208E2AD4|nr:DUF2058 domain-containing protein [Aliidiomarina quisquiliarum]MCO4321491.1 DUF2058 domain-containing protein [Aliidiomarina quisquiliarum]
MSKSLAEQLLGAGLVDEKKIKKARQEKRQYKKKIKSGQAVEDNSQRLELERKRAEQRERDRQLNLERQAQADERARMAQVLQMLQQSQLHTKGDIRFNFNDSRSNVIKSLYVDPTMQKHLANGKLAICAYEDSYYVVPVHVADKVAERYAASVLFIADASEQEPDEDDPYKDYQIPDDLMW